MNTQIKKIGVGLMLAALPLMASTALAQGTSQPPTTGVSVIFSDSPRIAPEYVHTIALNPEGNLDGQVASIDTINGITTGITGLNVFFVQNGQIIKQTKTGPDGTFEIHSINEGAYSFFATGKSGFAAYGVYVSGQPTHNSPNVLEATLASANYFGIQQLLKNNVPAQIASTVKSETRETDLGTPIPRARPVPLINGRLEGQILTMDSQKQSVANIHVHIIQDDQPIAQVQTDNQGKFVIPDLSPGFYDLVAAGEKSFAAGRFEAIGPRSVTSQVSFRKTAKLEFTLTQDDNAPIGAGNDVLIEPSYVEAGQYAGESVVLGGASGGSAGAVNNFSEFSGGGVVRGRFGGRGAGMGRFRAGAGNGRLLLIGGLATGLSFIGGGDDPGDSSPTDR